MNVLLKIGLWRHLSKVLKKKINSLRMKCRRKNLCKVKICSLHKVPSLLKQERLRKVFKKSWLFKLYTKLQRCENGKAREKLANMLITVRSKFLKIRNIWENYSREKICIVKMCIWCKIIKLGKYNSSIEECF